MTELAGQSVTLSSVVTRIAELATTVHEIDKDLTKRLDHLEMRMENMDVALFQDRRRSQEAIKEIGARLDAIEKMPVDTPSAEPDQSHPLIRAMMLLVDYTNNHLATHFDLDVDSDDWYD